MVSAIEIKKTATGYDVFLRSNEIDQGTYKTSYIFIGKTGKAAQYGNTVALSLSQ